VRRALTALGAPASSPAELRELVDVLDPEAEGWVAYENFVAVAALKLAARGEEELRGEVERAWRLFVQPGEDRITFATLKRVARELREEVDESVLRDMMREAGGGGVVGIKEFEGVMRRAGVFG
jgi:Ca2+-binding EF-hand superfamily protein